jgi:RND family efflux transporter MFP subunit
MKTTTLSLLSLALVTSFTSCSKHEPHARTDLLPDAPAIPVRVIQTQKSNHTADEEVVGTLRSRQQALVEAKVAGRIEQFLVVPGQSVKKEELLVQLDVREIAANLDSAKAMEEQAKRELERYRQLVEQNAATRQELEGMEARQKVASAQVSQAETMLSYARVTAPFDGVITRKLAEVGDLAMPGKLLLEVESPGDLRFETDLPEALLDLISKDQVMRIRVGKSELEGRVGEIAPIADAVSRTFRVKLDLPRNDALRSGQFGRVSVPVEEASVLSVPASAVIKRGQMEMVYVLRDGRAWMRLVKTGRPLRTGMEILSGLEEGESVIETVPARIIDGQQVEVEA